MYLKVKIKDCEKTFLFSIIGTNETIKIYDI